jgi:hypothetical protein
MTNRLFALACALLVIASPATLSGQVLSPWWPQIRSYCPAALRGDGWAMARLCLEALLSDDPVHFVAASIIPQSGIGAGVGVNRDPNGMSGNINLRGDLVITTKGFWATDDTLSWAPRIGPPANGRPRFQLYGQYRDLAALSFYGLGAASSKTAYTFGGHEIVGGTRVDWPLALRVTATAGAEYRRWRLDAPTDAFSVIRAFTEESVPGIAHQPGFAHYRGGLYVHSPGDSPSATVNAVYAIYQDLEGGRYSFEQFEMRAAKRLSLGSDTFTAKGLATFSRAFSGGAIPFYYEPTLGGSDVDGFDTLRGFADYRFRGAHRLLAQLEFSHRMWLDWLFLTGFYDAGMVGMTRSDLTMSALRQDYGMGVALVLAKQVQFRAYLAFGGGEGVVPGYKLSQGY